MVFNSIDFLIFFPLVYVLYLKFNFKKQNYLLLVASYFFYGYWDYRFLSLLFISTLVDFYTSNQIDKTEDSKKRKLFLYLSMISNLSMLGFFKYYNFFIQSAIDGLKILGVQANPYVLQIVLPLGISFYTFQTMSYTIDVYRKDLKAEKNFFDFALYVSYFPQLVAGPIERATNLLPQLKTSRSITADQFAQGSLLILIGFFKKVYIADNLGTIVDEYFKADSTLLLPEKNLTSLESLVGAIAFIFQIYGDFSGYSDIARGISKWMGIELIQNFKHPFFSESMNEFWRRWHISFMNWLKDYVYKSIGKKEDPEWKQHRNNIFVFLLSGLWHGANWNFVFWGLYCGIVTSLYRVYTRLFNPPQEAKFARKIINILFTFFLIVLSVVFFRSPNLGFIVKYFQLMFSFTGGIESNIMSKFLKLIFTLTILEFHQFLKDTEYSIFELKTFTRSIIYIVLFYLIIIMGNFNNGFIYFVF